MKQKDIKVTSDMAAMAPTTKGSKHRDPDGPFKEPKDGEQSEAPKHKAQALPSKDAPAGVKGPNAGSSMALPKSGGVGESEV